ncbi:MAG: hypothetical protein U0556_04745 [Dehalococcoidia bacterium]
MLFVRDRDRVFQVIPDPADDRQRVQGRIVRPATLPSGIGDRIVIGARQPNGKALGIQVVPQENEVTR